MTLEMVVVRLKYAFNRAKDQGVWWTAKEVSLRAVLWLLWLCLVPVSLPLHLAGLRRLPILTQRIGHLAAELDCFIKKVQLGQIDNKGKYFFVLAPDNKVSNLCLLDYWRDYIIVVKHPALCWALSLMTRGPLMRHDIQNYLLAIGRAAEYFSVASQWAERPALLQLRKEDQTRGEQFLANLGVPVGAWFVCVHARSLGYSVDDDNVHDYRNTKFEHLLPAMREIVARGGWCIRIGDVNTEPLPPMQGVVDYAHHMARSDELDIFFCAKCRFFLGNTSGLFLVSSVFGVPVALTNQTPFAATGFRPGDLSIPKRIRRIGHSEFLTSAEILRSPISNFRMSRFYIDAQLELIENSEEEILELVNEMLDVLDGRFRESPEAILYREKFTENLRSEHYCFGTTGKIASSFLLRHSSMF